MGTIRFFLAMCVVVYHLTQIVPAIGQFAVYAFYVISGYLMTLVLQEAYQFDLKRYAANRFIRLYPTHYVLVAFALGVFWCVPEYGGFHTSWSHSPSGGAHAGNLLIFPWAFLSDKVVLALPWTVDGLYFRILPSTWSIAMELICYMLLWLAGSRSIWHALALIAASAMWQVYWSFSDLSMYMRYFPVPAAAMGFSIGSLAYFASLKSSEFFNRVPLGLVVVAALGACLLNWHSSLSFNASALNTPHFYFNMILFFFVVLAVNRRRFSGLAGKIDRLLGDIAYPIFLGHYVFSLIGWKLLLPEGSPMRGWEVFWVGATLTILGSIVVIYAVDRPLEAVRAKVREGKLFSRRADGSGSRLLAASTAHQPREL